MGLVRPLCTNHCPQTTTWDNHERSLLPWEIIALCDDLLLNERSKLARYSINGDILDYTDHSDFGIDHMESARDFLRSIEEFVHRKAHELGAARTKLGLPSGLDKRRLSVAKNHCSQLQSKALLVSPESDANRAQRKKLRLLWSKWQSYPRQHYPHSSKHAWKSMKKLKQSQGTQSVQSALNPSENLAHR